MTHEPPPGALREAARRVLAADGRDYVLRPWQVAYCLALVEGRETRVPVACGLGAGWLDARLAAALATPASTPAAPGDRSASR